VKRTCKTFVVGLLDGDRVLTEGVIDANARYVFLHGYCEALAVALVVRLRVR
jgi:hypothetical protein